MADFGSADVGFLLVDGLDLLGATTKLNDDKEAMLQNKAGLGEAWPIFQYVGTKKYTLTQSGFFDDATDKQNDAQVGVGTQRVLSFGHAGNVIGRKMVGAGGILETKYTRIISANELHKAAAEYIANGQVDEGIILHALAAETAASGNTDASSVDNLAATTAGGAAYLQVTALTLGGYTDVTFRVRDSADDISFLDLTPAFANVATAPTAERIAITGTIRQFTSMSWAFNGAGAGQSVTAMVAIARD